MQLTAVLTEADEGGVVALNPETGTTTQGETISPTGRLHWGVEGFVEF